MIVSLFLFWRFGLFFVTFYGSKLIPQVANSSPGATGLGKVFNYWLSWAQWDGGNYLTIAAHGYQNSKYFAFAPLYPIFSKITSIVLGGNVFISGLVISNLAFVVFLMLFYRYLKGNHAKKVAANALITFLVFPTTFFTVAYYSESLFLLFAITFFLLISQKKYTESTLAVILASLTRFVGIILAVSLFYSYFSSLNFKIKKLNKTFFALFISFLGIIAFMFYLKSTQDNYFQFLTSQSYWQRQAIDPISTIFSYFWSFLTFQKRPLVDYFDFATLITFLTLLMWGVRKIPSSLWIFSMLAVLIPASTGTLSGMPRYALASLGTFIIIAKFLEKHPSLKIPIWTLSLVLQAILACLFINGYWIA